jgi:excisionase family DNA binding protein
MPERFLKLSEVRQILGVSRATLWRWTAERGLRVVRIGGVTRVRENDLQAFLNRHESAESLQAAEKAETEPKEGLGAR